MADNASLDETTLDGLSATLSELDDYYLETEQGLWIYLGWTILALGTVGHALTLLVILSSRENLKKSSAVYIIALSLAGLTAMYVGLLRFIIYAQTDYTLNLKELSDPGCKIHTGLSYFSLQYVAWLQASIAVDRVLAVVRPHWYSTVCDYKKGLAVTISELVTCLALQSGVFFTVGINDDGFCARLAPDWWKVWHYVDFISFAVLPGVVVIVSNGIIIARILSTRRRHRTRAQSTTLMLVTVNIVFVVTTVPISAIHFLKWQNYNQYKLYMVYSALSLLQYSGIASTFFIYCVSGSRFRKQLRDMFGRLCRSPVVAGQGRPYNRVTSQQTGSACREVTSSAKDRRLSRVSRVEKVNTETTSLSSLSCLSGQGQSG